MRAIFNLLIKYYIFNQIYPIVLSSLEKHNLYQQCEHSLSLLLMAFSSKSLGICPKRVFLLFSVSKMSWGGQLITDTLASHGSEKAGCQGWSERLNKGGRRRREREGAESQMGWMKHSCRSFQLRPPHTLSSTLYLTIFNKCGSSHTSK